MIVVSGKYTSVAVPSWSINPTMSNIRRVWSYLISVWFWYNPTQLGISRVCTQLYQVLCSIWTNFSYQIIMSDLHSTNCIPCAVPHGFMVIRGQQFNSLSCSQTSQVSRNYTEKKTVPKRYPKGTIWSSVKQCPWEYHFGTTSLCGAVLVPLCKKGTVFQNCTQRVLF